MRPISRVIRVASTVALSFVGLSSRAAEVLEREVSQVPVTSVSPGKASDFVVSPDGTRVTYVATASDKPPEDEGEGEGAGPSGPFVVITDGHKSAVYDEVNQVYGQDFIYSANSRRAAYIASRGQIQYVVVDGHEIGSPDEDVSSLKFSPDSSHYEYVVRTGRHRYQNEQRGSVVIDGKPGPEYWLIRQFAVSPDGKRLAYVAGDYPSGDRVVVDGKEIARYDSVGNCYVPR